MKFRHTSNDIRFAAVVLLLAATSCSKEEAPEGDRLAQGAYPLEIGSITLCTEGGEARPWSQPLTRVSETADGSGTMLEAGDYFTVRIEGGTKATIYTLQAEGNATSTSPLYWSDLNRHNVLAWYPAESGELSLADQTGKLAYLLNGKGEGDAKTPVTIAFTHALAKVRVTPTGETLSKIQSLSLGTFTKCSYSPENGVVGSEEGWVAMKQCTYDGQTCWEANVVPGKEITTLQINGTDSRDLSAAITPVAGKYYNITLKSTAPVKDSDYDPETNTYTVNTAVGLNTWAEAARADLTTNCILGANITLEAPADGSSNWTPIGSASQSYAGTFDGAGFTISNLTIVSSSSDQGLFGGIAEAEIRNLNLQDVNVSGSQQVGGLVGCTGSSSRIINCKVSGSVTGTDRYIGGIVGNNFGKVIASSFSGSVSANTYAGGIAGQNRGATIVGCLADGSIQGSSTYIGGIAGYNYGATLKASASRCQVSASNYIGGITGRNTGTIGSCYWDTYDGNGIGYGSGEATKVDGSTTTWAMAISAMNSAIDTWNGENDNACPYHFSAGSDGSPVITKIN